MSLHKSLADFLLVIPQTQMTDWQVVEGHRSSGSWSPGAQVMAGPHPPSALAAPGHSRDKPTGVPRRRLHGDEATGWPRLRLTPLWSAARRL